MNGAVPGAGPGDAFPGAGPGDAFPGAGPGDAFPGAGPGDKAASADCPHSADRHQRQERFRGIGSGGQQRIRDSSVLVIGVGALGSHLAECMLRAGVGRLELVDRDVVELQNLQRQTLFDEGDAHAGRPKAAAAATRLRAIDSGTEVVASVAEFDREFWDELEVRPDVVLDGTDNFATRFLINDLAVRDGVPWIHGAVVGSTGRAAVVRPGITPCLRCLLAEPPDGFEVGTCETSGVIEPAVATVAALQCTEALKLLSGQTDALCRGMVWFDLWSGAYRRSFVDAAPRPDCASCGTREFPALTKLASTAVSLCGRDTVQIRPALRRDLDLAAFEQGLSGIAVGVERTPHLLRFTADGCRISLFADGRALLFGIKDPLRARAIYDRWIGLS